MGQGTSRLPLVAALVAALTLGGCAAVARPGGYPDTLFVILKSQADLSDLTFVSDVHARRAAVYRRLVDTADRTQAALRRDLAALYLPYTPFYLVNGLRVQGDPAIRTWLSRRPEVDQILLNPRLPVASAPAVTPPGRVPVDGRPQPNLAAMRVDKVWANGVTGPGVTIGLADSGVDGQHPALRGAFRGGTDSWYDPWRGTSTATDPTGPGTEVLSAAVGSNGIGVAPGARWTGCVEPPGPTSDPAGYLSCLQFMLAPFLPGRDPLHDGHPDRAADVLVGSWDCAQPQPCDLVALSPAVRALTQAGMFLVSAVGTAGPRCGSITGIGTRYPGVLTVGSTGPGGGSPGGGTAPGGGAGPGGGGGAAPGLGVTPGGDGAQGSAGPAPPSGLRVPVATGRVDLVAPGVDVVAAVPGGGYARVSGSGVAAAEVAGVVALLWAVNPDLTGDLTRTRALLLDTATPIPASPACTGRMDAPARLVNADAAVHAAETG